MALVWRHCEEHMVLAPRSPFRTARRYVAAQIKLIHGASIIGYSDFRLDSRL
ncbi:hypothetical protein D9M68_340810 [compost metagenome]